MPVMADVRRDTGAQDFCGGTLDFMPASDCQTGRAHFGRAGQVLKCLKFFDNSWPRPFWEWRLPEGV